MCLWRRDFDENSPEFTLELIIGMQMQDFAEPIKEISTAAAAELNIENVGISSVKNTLLYFNLKYIYSTTHLSNTNRLQSG